MASNAFIGRTKAPNDADLASALGESKALWDRVLGDLQTELDLVDLEWKSYSPKQGWSARLKRGSRNILHLAPCEGSFIVVFILGQKAVQAVRSGVPSRRLTKLLDDAPQYPEGTGIRIDPVGARDVPLIRKLARIKLAN